MLVAVAGGDPRPRRAGRPARAARSGSSSATRRACRSTAPSRSRRRAGGGSTGTPPSSCSGDLVAERAGTDLRRLRAATACSRPLGHGRDDRHRLPGPRRPLHAGATCCASPASCSTRARVLRPRAAGRGHHAAAARPRRRAARLRPPAPRTRGGSASSSSGHKAPHWTPAGASPGHVRPLRAVGRVPVGRPGGRRGLRRRSAIEPFGAWARTAWPALGRAVLEAAQVGPTGPCAGDRRHGTFRPTHGNRATGVGEHAGRGQGSDGPARRGTRPLDAHRAGQQRHQRGVAHPHPRRARNRRASNRLYREALVAAALPPEVGYPTVVAHGGGRGEDWLVAERVPGRAARPRAGPTSATPTAVRAVEQLADAARRPPRHARRRPTCPPIENAPQLLEVGAADPTGPWSPPCTQAMSLHHVDPVMLANAIELVDATWRRRWSRSRRRPSCTATSPSRTCSGTRDRSPPCSTSSGPGPGHATSTSTSSCAAPPTPSCTWATTTSAAPAPRTTPRCRGGSPRPTRRCSSTRDQIDRVRVYSIAYDVRDLLASPPQAAPRHLPELHAYHRLQRSCERKSYIDVLGRGRV